MLSKRAGPVDQRVPSGAERLRVEPASNLLGRGGRGHIPHHPQLGGRSYGYYVIVQSSGHDRLLDGVASEDGNQNEHIWTEPSWSRPVAVPIQEG